MAGRSDDEAGRCALPSPFNAAEAAAIHALAGVLAAPALFLHQRYSRRRSTERYWAAAFCPSTPRLLLDSSCPGSRVLNSIRCLRPSCSCIESPSPRRGLIHGIPKKTREPFPAAGKSNLQDWRRLCTQKSTPEGNVDPSDTPPTMTRAYRSSRFPWGHFLIRCIRIVLVQVLLRAAMAREQAPGNCYPSTMRRSLHRIFLNPSSTGQVDRLSHTPRRTSCARKLRTMQ